ncbi:unnamed protein product [Mucor hiemalis]
MSTRNSIEVKKIASIEDQKSKHTACVIRGISKPRGDLPLQAMKNEQYISKYDLTITYLHPILSCILSSPETRVLLRSTSIGSDSSGDKRPDAISTKFTQLSYGPNLGFDEKPMIPTIDTHHWKACLAFQIHGFSGVIYLMRTNHKGIYMYIITKV